MQGASSVLKALLLKNIVTIVFKLKQCSGRLWIYSGEFLSPGEAQAEIAVVALNKTTLLKVWFV